MDGKYLASNIAPLKTIGDGKTFVKITEKLNNDHFESVDLVAYSITGSDDRIVNVECLFKYKERTTLYFRDFDFYKRTENLEDGLKMSADYGAGFADHNIDRFLILRDFYLEKEKFDD